jgi:CubicO group peptidase (beta-lactamase class C family)
MLQMIRLAEARSLKAPRVLLLLALPVAIVLLAWPAVSAAQPAATDPRFERIATVVSQKMKEYGVPGVALGIFVEGKRQTRGFGVTSVENPLPVTESTLFQAGSITKTMTGTVVMRLVEAGKLKRDAPVRDYLPSFRVQDDNASQNATVRTLLTHMGDWEGDFFDDPGNGDDALARMVDRMGTLAQIAPFNTIWSYNNAGFFVAGRLIEQVTGKPYEAALKQLLIEPLGLRQTFIIPTDVMTYRFAVGHAGPIDKPIVLRPWPLARVANPAGGVATSIDDLLRYGQFHLGDGSAPGGARLLSPESMRLMQQTQLVKQGTDEEMALTWQVSKMGGLREIWHDGAAVGQMALLALVPSRQLALALLTNSVQGELLNHDVARAVAKEYLGVAISDPSPIAVPKTELTQYAGRYSRPFMDVVVTVKDDRLLIQLIQKQGFPTPSSFVPPPAPPTPYAFYAKDRLIVLGLVQGSRAEFLREPDGSVRWIRIGGRIARRLAPAHDVTSEP